MRNIHSINKLGSYLYADPLIKSPMLIKLNKFQASSVSTSRAILTYHNQKEFNYDDLFKEEGEAYNEGFGLEINDLTENSHL